MRRMKSMKTKEQKNAVKKHENTPNQSPQKRGADIVNASSVKSFKALLDARW